MLRREKREEVREDANLFLCLPLLCATDRVWDGEQVCAAVRRACGFFVQCSKSYYWKGALEREDDGLEWCASHRCARGRAKGFPFSCEVLGKLHEVRVGLTNGWAQTSAVEKWGGLLWEGMAAANLSSISLSG